MITHIKHLILRKKTNKEDVTCTKQHEMPATQQPHHFPMHSYNKILELVRGPGPIRRDSVSNADIAWTPRMAW